MIRANLVHVDIPLALPLAVIVLLSATSFTVATSAETRSRSGTSTCVSGFCLHKDYNRLEVPERPTKVHIKFRVQDVTAVNDVDFSVTMYAYIVLRWTEPRLNRTRSENTTLGWNAVDTRFSKSLWIPNVLIVNVKSFKTMSGLEDETGLFIRDAGPVEPMDVLYIQLAEVTILCPMRFDLYPLDSHNCKLLVHSSYDASTIYYHPMELNYDTKRRTIILEYAIGMNPLDEQRHKFDMPAGNNFSFTGLEMSFVRNKFKYVTMYYLPSSLFVVVSWVSFLIPPEIVAGRMAMLITLLLVLINFFTSITSNMPSTDGITAIAAWMLSCVFFVFCALMAYAYLLWRLKPSLLKKHWRREGKNEVIGRKPSRKGSVTATSDPDDRAKTPMGMVATGSAASDVQLVRVDDACLVVFPVVFGLFHVVYWTTCLSHQPETFSWVALMKNPETASQFMFD